MTENSTHPAFTLPQPLVAPLGVEVTPAMVQDVWDTFVKPGQSDDAPPQSAEMRALMGILRAVNAALEADPAETPAEITPGARTVPPGVRGWSSGPTDHPLTEAAAVEMWDASPCREGYEFRGMLTVEQGATVYAMRAAFDAGREHERANPVDDRPWEPLNEGDPVHVGYEVRQDRPGITVTAVVARVDKDGDPWTAEGYLIGRRDWGTWYVRRAVQELPTEPDAVIERADGHKYITAMVDGETYRAREAMLSGERWHAVWRRDSSRGAISFVRSHEITPGTWKVDDQ